MGEDYNSTFLHFTLNESMEQFSHSRGILPFKVESLFTRKLRPTFLLFDFKTEKVVWGDVNVWFIGSSIPIYTSILFIHILVHSLIAIRVRIWTRDLLSTNLIIKMMNRLLGCWARCFVHYCSTGKYKNNHKQFFFSFFKKLQFGLSENRENVLLWHTNLHCRVFSLCGHCAPHPSPNNIHSIAIFDFSSMWRSYYKMYQ